MNLPRPTVAVAMIALAPSLGCDPCASYQATDVMDEAALLDEAGLATLTTNLDTFLAWTDSARVCLDRVEVVDSIEDDRASELVATSRDWYMRITPAAALSQDETWEGLCAALDTRGNLSAQQPELWTADRLIDVPEDASEDDVRRWSFAEACADGPPMDDWAAEVTAACGESPLEPVDAFLSASVWVNAPTARVDGPLVTTTGTSVRMPVDVGTMVTGAAGAPGSIVAAIASATIVEVRVIDTATGVATPVFSSAPGVSSYSVYGGDGLVVVERIDGVDGAILHVRAQDGSWSDVGFPAAYTWDSAVVSAGGLWGFGSGAARPLGRIDLADGTVTEIPLLPPTDPTLVSMPMALSAVPGGVAVFRHEALVTEGQDWVDIRVMADMLDRWDDGQQAWETLLPDVPFLPVPGDGAGGVTFGTLRGAGSAFGAYDAATDALLVASDLCIVNGGPRFAADGAAWVVYADGDAAVVFEPHTVVPVGG